MKENEYIEEFLKWTSGGAMSASLAFIVFVPTLNNVDAGLQDLSIGCFVGAIPFLALSLGRYKEYELKKENSLENATSHLSTAVVGVLLMVVGFSLLLAAIDFKYLIVFFLAVFFVIILEIWDNRKEKHK